MPNEPRIVGVPILKGRSLGIVEVDYVDNDAIGRDVGANAGNLMTFLRELVNISGDAAV